MITVKTINIAPVKSLALVSPDRVTVDFHGITEDRRFYLVDDMGELLTQRELGRLVQVRAEYQAHPELLRLRFPDGTDLAGPVEPEEPVLTRIWGRRVTGHVAGGQWNEALSQFCQHPVRLVASDQPGQCFDEFPLSMVSQASVDGLSHRTGGAVTFEASRFRPTFLLEGSQPHQEDAWLGGSVQIGEELRLQVVARDPRCSIITQNPITGERDADALRLILSYRPSRRAAYFGVYGLVEQPGSVALGDVVTAL
jgi:uncharacterized protein YcbX